MTNNTKKNSVCLIVIAATLIALLLLPLVSVTVKGITNSVSLFDVLFTDETKVLISGKLFNIVNIEFYTIMCIVAFVSGIVALIATLCDNRKSMVVSSVLSAAMMVIAFATIIAPIKLKGYEFAYSAGIGIWVALAGFIVTAVLTVVLGKKANQ